MTATMARRTRVEYVASEHDWTILVSWLMARFKFDLLKDPSEAFLEYLEGYASSYDIYAVCPRQTEDTYNYDLLAKSFWEEYLREAAKMQRSAGTQEHVTEEEGVAAIERAKN